MNTEHTHPMSAALPFRPKAIAFDLDGTLIDDDAHLADSLIPAVRRIGDAGIKVFIVTGRLILGAERFWRALGLDTPLACCNGGVVGFPGAEPLYHARLDKAALRKIVDIDVAGSLYFNYSIDNAIYTLKNGPMRDYYSSHYSFVTPLLEPEAILAMNAPTKCLCITPEEEQAGVIDMLRNALGDTAAITTSNNRFIEIMPPGVDKGTGIALLADWLGTTPESFAAVGDAMNDLPMLRKAGFAVSFNHGDPRLAEHADILLPPLWEGGMNMLVETVLGIRD